MIYVVAIVVATVRRGPAYDAGAVHADDDQDEPRDGAEREQPDVLAKGGVVRVLLENLAYRKLTHTVSVDPKQLVKEPPLHIAVLIWLYYR